jgi:ActR/RegA family two-component response regulator
MSRGARALIVEDDVILGWALERALYKAGFRAVKLVVSIDQALEQLRYGSPDVALLDLRLRGGTLSLPVADLLEDAGVPFVFLTGHSRELISERHRGRPYLMKPASEAEIVETLTAAMAPVPLLESA